MTSVGVVDQRGLRLSAPLDSPPASQTEVQMRRIGLAVVLALSLLRPLAAWPRQAGKIHRIGVLANIRSPATEGVQQGLRDLGYVEGRNVVVEWRLAEGRFERLTNWPRS